MKYKILLIAVMYGNNGNSSMTSQVVEFDTRAEAEICLKEFKGNSVIDAFQLNWVN